MDDLASRIKLHLAGRGPEEALSAGDLARRVSARYLDVWAALREMGDVGEANCCPDGWGWYQAGPRP